MWRFIIPAMAIAFVVNVDCLGIHRPMQHTATNLMPLPPKSKETKPYTLLLINTQAVKNGSIEESNNNLHDDFVEELSDVIAEPTTILFILKPVDDIHPVNLDEVARDLEKDGLIVHRIVKDGETRAVTVNHKPANIADDDDSDRSTSEQTLMERTEKLMKVRRKRMLKFKKKGGGKGCG